jgi:hypothetical protein
MMMTKQIINNYNDNNQHNRGKADASEANEDVVRTSKMTKKTTMEKKKPMMQANQIIKL